MTGPTGATGSKPAGQFWIGAAGMWPSLTSGCKVNSQVEMASNKENFYTLDFVDGSTTYCEGSVMMPSDYDGGTITVTFEWFANDVTNNAVVWQAEGIIYGDGDALDAAYGTPQTVTDANASTANQNRISAATAALTFAGTPAASKLAQFRFARLGSNGSDSLTADARLLGVMISFTRV